LPTARKSLLLDTVGIPVTISRGGRQTEPLPLKSFLEIRKKKILFRDRLT
jgi:hypothetical protein